MRIKTGWIFVTCVFLLSVSLGSTLGQETVAEEPETQWVWAEAVFCDPVNKNLTVKYLDYETDQEKQLTLNIDEKTTFENIKSLEGIKPKDTLSIDYVVTPDAKNIARNISFEKSEEGLLPTVTPPEAAKEPAAQQSAPANP